MQNRILFYPLNLKRPSLENSLQSQKNLHLGLLWVETESTAVELDGCFEVLAIVIASNSPFDRHDLAIDSLSHRIRDTEVAVADHIGQSLPIVVATFFI
jgi:hypothetical protein